MYLKSFAALALSILAANAFSDTSPFIFFSTSEILASPPQIISSSSLSITINTELEKCLSDTYVIVSQPGVNAADYSGRHAAPHLKNWLSGKDRRIRSSFAVTDVVGQINTATFAETLETRCGATTLSVDASTGQYDIVEDMKPRIMKVDFPFPSSGASRAQGLEENGVFLSSVLDMLPSVNFTVIYTTTPSSLDSHGSMAEPDYHSDNTALALFQGRIELKRVLSGRQGEDEPDTTLPDGPLFEKYQFFTPAIFLGGAVSLFMLMILYVGISALSSLQVSYAAFDRENGPAAQKKQQ